MRADVWKLLGASHALIQMQAYKSRCVEFVRWRSTKTQVNDPQFNCIMHCMKTALKFYCRTNKDAENELGQLAHLFEGGDDRQQQHRFLNEMHHRALKVTKLNKEDNQAERDEVAKLVTVLPAVAIEKIGEDKLHTVLEQANLVSCLHRRWWRGEVLFQIGFQDLDTRNVSGAVLYVGSPTEDA